ncbi:MAG: ribonuclease HI [Spirochaetales bacterium]
MIDIYTDGGSSGNPGPGGWAYILVFPDGTRLERAGKEEYTTNNKMELRAVLEALEYLSYQWERLDSKEPLQQGEAEKPKVRIHTDSQYVQLGITDWIYSWVKNGWRTSNRKPVKNRELWEQLWHLIQLYQIQWVWIKGHAGDPYNEYCDSLVQQEIKKIKK